MPFDKAPAERLPSFFQGNDTVDEKKMSGGLAFMVNGYMCCGMWGKTLPSALDRTHLMNLFDRRTLGRWTSRGAP